MSTRERWIVYPLLFLALGVALRDKIVPVHKIVISQEIRARTIRCGELEAERAKFESMAAEHVLWKEPRAEAGTIRLGLRLLEEPAPKKRPAKADTPE